jgi:anionic cell wall polymer biosynthesis LytR-Cps2A-Psr (LCP) family protein
VQGGAELLFQTLEYNLGVRPQHWALAHLDDFSRFVDDLGGLDLQVPVAIQFCSIPEGSVHLDGFTTLCYVRWRGEGSDFDRIPRQQAVLLALFQRFLSLDSLRQLPDWYSRYSQTMQTDLTLADLLANIPFILRLHYAGSLYHFQVDWEEVTGWKVPKSGASVLLPRQDQIRALLQSALDVLNTPHPTSPVLDYFLAELTATPEP